MNRIRRATVGAVLVLAALAGCGGDADAPEAAPAVRDAAIEEVSDMGPDDTSDQDLFKVAPADVRIEKCGRVDEDSASDVAFVLITNSAPVTRHFHITVNTYGPDGVRGEAMYATAYSVASGETARARGNTGEESIPGTRCELGQMLAIPSEGVPDGHWWWTENAS